jgi:hypothetical protein
MGACLFAVARGWWDHRPVTDHVTEPETREALAAHLCALRVREDSYHLFGGHLDHAMIMD